MNKTESFCCTGIRILMGDYLSDGEVLLSPLGYTKERGYSFTHCYEVFFCPICGKDLKYFSENISVADSQLENLNLTKSNNPSFCCEVLECCVDLNNEHPDYFQIYYQVFARRFFFSQSTDWRNGEPVDKIYQEWELYYCIFCGAKFSTPLLNEWLQMVDQQFGVSKQLPLEKMLPLIPEEFRTEEWWRTRGL